MPFALIIIGAFLLISAARDTQADLFSLLQGDFTGSNNFIYWMTSILLIGALGYIPKLKPLSVAFLVLVITVLVFSKGDPSKMPGGGLFEQFTNALSTTQTTSAVTVNGKTTQQPTTIGPVQSNG